MSYRKVTCYVCGREISTAGFAIFHHRMMHVREGKLIRRTYWDDEGKHDEFRAVPMGMWPKEDEEKGEDA